MTLIHEATYLGQLLSGATVPQSVSTIKDTFNHKVGSYPYIFEWRPLRWLFMCA
mgnify:CR=1 FL=1